MRHADNRRTLTDACQRLYRWPAGYGSIVGRLHLHSDHGCADGVLAVKEDGGIEVDVRCLGDSYTHVAAAKDMAAAINLCADRDHPFMVPDEGEVLHKGGDHTILGPTFQICATPSPITVRVRHGHIASVTEQHDDIELAHHVLTCTQVTHEPDKVVFTNISRTVRTRGTGGIDAHQAISINYTYLEEMAVPVGVRVMTSDGDGAHAWEAMWLEPSDVLIPDHPGQLTCE